MIKICDILDFLNEQNIEFVFNGNKDTDINGFSSLKNYKKGTMTWIKETNSISENFDINSITLAFVQEGTTAFALNQIISTASKRAFFFAIEYFFAKKDKRPEIGQGTYISSGVRLGQNVRIGYNCVLDGDIFIGDNTQIWDNVSIINKVVIGENCNIQSGVRIGHDGFGYSEDQNHIKTMVTHYGGVQIGNQVYIGPNCVIDRGTIDNTCIEDGCKLDGLVFVAHNVSIKSNSAIIAGAVLLGSIVVEDNAYISTSTIQNQLKIGKNAFVGVGSVVIRDVPENITVVGNPARPLEKKGK